ADAGRARAQPPARGAGRAGTPPGRGLGRRLAAAVDQAREPRPALLLRGPRLRAHRSGGRCGGRAPRGVAVLHAPLAVRPRRGARSAGALGGHGGWPAAARAELDPRGGAELRRCHLAIALAGVLLFLVGLGAREFWEPDEPRHGASAAEVRAPRLCP